MGAEITFTNARNKEAGYRVVIPNYTAILILISMDSIVNFEGNKYTRNKR